MFYVIYFQREATVNLTASNTQYTFQAKMRFTIAAHTNSSFIFEAMSEQKSLTFSSKFIYIPV